MSIMTAKMDRRLYDLQCAASGGLPANLARYVRTSVRLVRRQAEYFESRKALAEYVDTLENLVSTKVNS